MVDPYKKTEFIIPEKKTDKIDPKIYINENLIELLNKFKDINVFFQENYKAIAYTNAINNIKKLKNPININIAKIMLDKHMFGKKIYLKVIEYIKSGDIKELSHLINKYNQYQNLLKVKGMGIKTVNKFFKMGIYNVNDLNKVKHLLTNTQLLGIKYYNDFNTKIPRQEITDLMINFYNHILIPFDIAGSYRRNKEYSSDIDIIIKIEDILQKYNNIENFKQIIYKYKYFIDFLTSGTKKISLIIKSPITNIIRQVDIILVLKKEYYSALIYFTGSKEFNERLRSLLKRKGYTLNEYYLLNNKTKYYISSEKEIFKIAQIKYIKPEFR